MTLSFCINNSHDVAVLFKVVHQKLWSFVSDFFITNSAFLYYHFLILLLTPLNCAHYQMIRVLIRIHRKAQFIIFIGFCRQYFLSIFLINFLFPQRTNFEWLMVLIEAAHYFLRLVKKFLGIFNLALPLLLFIIRAVVVDILLTLLLLLLGLAIFLFAPKLPFWFFEKSFSLRFVIFFV